MPAGQFNRLLLGTAAPVVATPGGPPHYPGMTIIATVYGSKVASRLLPLS
jgi:hypothetical protein